MLLFWLETPSEWLCKEGDRPEYPWPKVTQLRYTLVCLVHLVYLVGLVYLVIWFIGLSS